MTTYQEWRYAMVRNADTRKQLEAYLPDGYEVMAETTWPPYDGAAKEDRVFVIRGLDVAGWTLDEYVIPRLLSGLIACVEIDLSHGVMKKVPAP